MTYYLWQETKSPDETTSFERWAERLARNKGFAYLSEEDVAYIVHESRAEHYQRYRNGEVSFGRLAEELGMTTWGLSHLLEEFGWPVSNLPAAH